jgi:predicted ArsR family transcriptional regulator
MQADTTAMEAEMDWQRLARANTHPLRISVLEVLGMDEGRTLSPSDLSYELRVPLSNVNYHVTELAKSGLIELASQRQVRGATEHFYRLLERSNGAGTNGHRRDLEKRTTGLEPATSSLGSSRSTN